MFRYILTFTIDFSMSTISNKFDLWEELSTVCNLQSIQQSISGDEFTIKFYISGSSNLHELHFHVVKELFLIGIVLKVQP